MAQGVPFVTLDRQHAVLADELRAAFDRVLASSGFILGAEVDAFEAEFAAYCGTEHCVGVASGTAALTLAFLAAGIGRGDEVIVPAHTYIASALGVHHAGATPVFCDVDPRTGLIDADAAAAAITERTAAILPVHLYGQVCDMEKIGNLAARHGLAVIEDGAQAHGATWDGRRAGSFGAASAFSFYPSKNLGALGDGGAICTDDPVIARRARELRNIGQRKKGEHVAIGFNERLDGLQAALLRVKLPHLDQWNFARQRLAAMYDERLRDHVEVLPDRDRGPCIYHVYAIRLEDRDGLAERLQSDGIQATFHYTPAVPDQPPFRGCRTVGDVEHARTWARTELSLPMSAELRDDEIERVATALVSAFSSQAR